MPLGGCPEGAGSREVVAAGCCPAEETRHWFERRKILERLFLCWLQVPTLCTPLQSHAGLIMSSSKHNLFTKCAGFCHWHRCAFRAHGRSRSPQPTDTARRTSDPVPGGALPSWPLGSGGTGRSCHSPLSAAALGAVFVGG